MIFMKYCLHGILVTWDYIQTGIMQVQGILVTWDYTQTGIMQVQEILEKKLDPSWSGEGLCTPPNMETAPENHLIVLYKIR